MSYQVIPSPPRAIDWTQAAAGLGYFDPDSTTAFYDQNPRYYIALNEAIDQRTGARSYRWGPLKWITYPQAFNDFMDGNTPTYPVATGLTQFAWMGSHWAKIDTMTSRY
jgi:hypothetical protein